MPLYLKDGKLLVAGGKLATGQGCCCGGPTGACCINGVCDPSYTTQEECEACETVNTCTEYLFLEDPEQSCPEGWTSDGFGGCSRVTNPESCEDCTGWCDSTQTGPCGDWIENTDCNATPDCTGVVGYYICGIPDTFAVPVDNTSPRPAPGFRQTGFEYLPDGLYIEYDPLNGQFTSAAPYSGTLANTCGRWTMSIGPFSQGNLCDVPTMSIVLDFGPVVPGECIPLSGTGVLYWEICRDCQTPCGWLLPGPALISGSTPISVTLSETPCS